MKEHVIKHQGIICELNTEIAKIKLVNVSACSSCHAKAGCTVSDVDNKVIEVPVNSRMFSQGERVTVFFNDSLGVKALLLGYVLPFFVMLTALLFTWLASGSEIYAGVAAVLILLPYYLLLAVFKKRLQQTFAFRLEKNDL